MPCYDRAAGWSARPYSPAAYRPSTPALQCLSHLGYCDLLFSCGQVGARRITQSTVALPGVLVELHTAVEAVAGVDGPVTAGLARGERVPRGAVAHRRHLGARLGTDPLYRWPGGCHYIVGHQLSACFDAVDGQDREGDVLGAGSAGVVDDTTADVHCRVLDAPQRRRQRHARIDGVHPDAGDHDLHALGDR